MEGRRYFFSAYRGEQNRRNAWLRMSHPCEYTKVFRTGYLCRASPRANHSRRPSRPSEVGQKRPLQTWNRRSYPTPPSPVIWPIASPSERLVRDGPALDLHNPVAPSGARRISPVSENPPIAGAIL